MGRLSTETSVFSETRESYKDGGLALDAAHEQHLELPVTQALVPRWQEAIADGHGDEDVSTVIAVASPRLAV